MTQTIILTTKMIEERKIHYIKLNRFAQTMEHRPDLFEANLYLANCDSILEQIRKENVEVKSKMEIAEIIADLLQIIERIRQAHM